MASDFEKPDKTHTLYQREIAQKMWPLPVSALFTCGHSSAETLHKLGILTIGDLAKTDPAILEAHLKVTVVVCGSMPTASTIPQ